MCTKYSSEMCDKVACGVGDGDCDVDDGVGCLTGLVCGVDNCKKFHKLGSSTGMGSSSDCCYAPYPSCAQHSKCDTNSFCATMCHTGTCGNQANVVAGTAGKFCQPCTRCNF